MGDDDDDVDVDSLAGLRDHFFFSLISASTTSSSLSWVSAFLRLNSILCDGSSRPSGRAGAVRWVGELGISNQFRSVGRSGGKTGERRGGEGCA